MVWCPDDYRITAINRTGYVREPPIIYVCPVCGEDLSRGDKVYKNNIGGQIIGCEHCIDAVDTEDEFEN